MTALLLTACVGMITGAFLIFRISPMDFTLGVFHRLTVGPRSIRDEINEATQRKKPNFMRREILEVQTILKATGKEDRFPMLCAASLLFFAMGAGIAMARAQELEVHPGAVSFYGHNGAQTERSLNPWTPRQGGAARHP